MENKTFNDRHAAGLPDAAVAVTVTWDQLKRASDEPNCGQPAYEITYPMGNPEDVVRGTIFVTKNYQNLLPMHGWVAGDAAEPLTTALNLAGAERVDAQDSRALGGNFELERSLINRDFTTSDFTAQETAATGTWDLDRGIKPGGYDPDGCINSPQPIQGEDEPPPVR